MKIAFISHEFPPDTGKGGIGTYVRQVARALAAHGDDVHVFAGSSYREGMEQSNEYCVHRVKCDNGHDFREKVVPIFAVQNALTPFELMESPEINGNAWKLKEAFPLIPLIVRLHAPNHLVESLKKTYLPVTAKLRFVLGALRRFKFDLGYWRPYVKEDDADYQFIQLADFISAPSISMKNWVVNNWEIAPDNITVIPNLFSPSQDFLNIPIQETAIHKRIVFFGRLNVLKGLVNATKAMKEVLREYPDWQFKIIGDDGPGPNNNLSMRAWMKDELKGLENQVDFVDGMDYEELPAAISDSEIVLLPGLFESFSYTCAEAMAAGKAVVGSNNAGMADLIEDAKSGLLINPYKHKEIIEAVKKLIVDNEYRYRLSVQARKTILEKQDALKTINLFEAYYKSIIGKKVVKN